MNSAMWGNVSFFILFCLKNRDKDNGFMYKCKELCFQILRFALDDTEGGFGQQCVNCVKSVLHVKTEVMAVSALIAFFVA